MTFLLQACPIYTYRHCDSACASRSWNCPEDAQLSPRVLILTKLLLFQSCQSSTSIRPCACFERSPPKAFKPIKLLENSLNTVLSFRHHSSSAPEAGPTSDAFEMISTSSSRLSSSIMFEIRFPGWLDRGLRETLNCSGTVVRHWHLWGVRGYGRLTRLTLNTIIGQYRGWGGYHRAWSLRGTVQCLLAPSHCSWCLLQDVHMCSRCSVMS